MYSFLGLNFYYYFFFFIGHILFIINLKNYNHKTRCFNLYISIGSAFPVILVSLIWIMLCIKLKWSSENKCVHFIRVFVLPRCAFLLVTQLPPRAIVRLKVFLLGHTVKAKNFILPFSCCLWRMPRIPLIRGTIQTTNLGSRTQRKKYYFIFKVMTGNKIQF